MEGLDYAQRLKKLHMYSIQRRNERFKILYLCKIPRFRPRGKARKARDNSFALTACNLWNSLPMCIRGIAGESVLSFKNKLDKVLAYYPDVPRCSESGHSYDSNLRKSNSLCDHYRDKRVGPIVNSITEV